MGISDLKAAILGRPKKTNYLSFDPSCIIYLSTIDIHQFVGGAVIVKGEIQEYGAGHFLDIIIAHSIAIRHR